MQDKTDTSEDLEAAKRFKENMELLNRARNETMAVTIDEVGTNQGPRYTKQAGEQKAGATASMAARGIALGVSGALNPLAINSNTTRQAWAAAQRQTKTCLGSRACKQRKKTKGE